MRWTGWEGGEEPEESRKPTNADAGGREVEREADREEGEVGEALGLDA